MENIPRLRSYPDTALPDDRQAMYASLPAGMPFTARAIRKRAGHDNK